MGRFRVVRGPGIIGMYPDLEAIKAALRGGRVDRYIIEEIAAAGEPLSSGYSCERWGTAFVWPNGTVELNQERP
jgi:hypothetical protein